MANTYIEIDGELYPVKFGYGAFRAMGAMWQCKGINDTIQHLTKLDGVEGDLTFEQADIIADVVLAGIKCAGVVDVEINRDDIMDAILADPGLMAQVMEDLASSFPTAKPGETAPKTKKKKT